MYKKRRIERVFEDLIKRAAEGAGVKVKVNKFAHNEMSPEDMQLKYDVRFEDEESFHKFIDSFMAKGFTKFFPYGDTYECPFYCSDDEVSWYACYILSWYCTGEEYDNSSKEEDLRVKMYEDSFHTKVPGSKEEDDQVLRDEDYEWGFIESIKM